MSKNSKENQSFKSFDVIAIVVLLVLGIFFYTNPFNNNSDKESVKNSKSKAEILGYQIAQIYRDQLLEETQTSKRGPASAKVDFKKEGLIGSDASGKPFKYKILEEGPNTLRVILTNKNDNDSSINDSENVHVEIVVPIKEAT
jgi:hypothetical protein